MDNLRTITQEGNMETRQKTPFFSSTFSVLTACNVHFLFETSQNSFSCGPLFGLFWSVKYLNFGQKVTIRTTHDTFLESRHTEVTKNPYYVSSHEGSQKKGITSWPMSFLEQQKKVDRSSNFVQFWRTF